MSAVKFLRMFGLIITLVFASPTWAEFYASKVAQTTYDSSPALVIRLTDALDEQTQLADYVSVRPKPTNGTNWITLDGGYSWTLPFVEPDTEYRVMFEQKPVSVNGDTFVAIKVSSSSSREQYSNSWKVKTERLSPAASFSSSGQYLTTQSPKALPITVTNIDAVELDIFRVEDDKLEEFLNQSFYSGRIRYNQLNRLNRWAERVHTARYEFDIRQHKRETINLDVTPATDAYSNGVYVAVLRKPGVYEYQYDTTFFTQSDIGLHVRFMGEEVQAMVNSIQTGKPLNDIDITFYWPKQGSRSERTRLRSTNAYGLASERSSNMPSIIVAKSGNEISFVTPRQNQLDLSAYANVPSRHQPIQSFIYGPRDLYRPGETVNINMLLRDYDGRNVGDTPVMTEIRDARGSKVTSFLWWPTDSGLYQHEFVLDSNAPTGEWSLVTNSEEKHKNRYPFKVEEFLPERLTMSFFDGERKDYRYVEKRNGNVPINGQYLYGAPAAGNKADGIATATIATDLFEQWDDYRFGNASEQIRRATQPINEIKLDDKGDGQLTLPNTWGDVKSPLNIRVTASVYESGGRPITRSQSVISLPPKVDDFIGVRPQFESRPKANQRVKFDLINVSREGELKADSIALKLIRKTRDYYWFYDDSNGWNHRWRSDAYVAFASKIELTELGAQQIELPLQSGDYELELTGSNGNKTVYSFRTQYSWANQGASSLKPNVLDIVLDQDHYQPGESAQLTFNAEAAGTALMQVESSDGVIYSEVIAVQMGENTFNVDIENHWTRHDLYLTLMLLNPADQVSEVAPTRSLGISHLPIMRENALLKTRLVAPEKVEPNQTVSAKVLVDNIEAAEGAPIYATVALVDMGILNITRFKRPQPEQFFFSPRRFENKYLDMYGKVINNLGFDTYQQRFGGGFADSDDALARGGDKAKSEVQMISFISDPVQVINGEATIEFAMPAFNGRVKWMVVTWTADAFGSDESEMTVADKLVTQLAMPRFLAMGDESQLTLDVHNLSDSEQKLDVKLSINGSIATPFKTQTLNLDDREKASLVIPVTATDYQGSGDIELTISNGKDINLQRSWSLGVRAPFPMQTRQTRQVIEANDNWQPNFKTDDLIARTVKAQLTLSDRPAINFSAHVDYLLRYPYGCLEQTTSSTYPWVLVDEELFNTLDLAATFNKRFELEFSDKLRREQLQNGLSRLYKKQKSDGTFGYWNMNSSPALWGTAYATELMIDARTLGVPVDKTRLQNALNALKKLANNQTKADIWTDDSNSYQASYRAYSAYVLAKANQSNISDLRRVYEQLERAQINHSSLPWMHLAAAFDLAGDVTRATDANTKALAIKRQRNRYYADYGSSVRDTALSLTLALEHNLNSGELPAQLETQLAARRWLSTQERIALVKVAKAFALNGDAWQGELITRNGNQLINKSAPFNSVVDGETLLSLEQINAQDKKLFANILWQGVPKQAPLPMQEGMRIDRDYYQLDGNRADLKTGVNSGDLLIVKLTVQSTEYRFPEALVVELLPAGFELENQNLLNASVDLDSITIEGSNVGEYFRNYRVEYEEYRDDRYVSAISVVPWNSTTLFYLVRAVTPGTYSLPNSYVEDMYRPENQAIGFSIGKVTVRAEP